MADNGTFRLQPAEVADVSARLDELADRVEKLIDAESANLAVSAAGRDEVSQRVATSLNDVHGTFVTSTVDGTNEIREIAATLRAHADGVTAVDQGFTD
ncbi:hypothetical protein BH11ACT6_BH11ACT6_35450 [soil metagenome]